MALRLTEAESGVILPGIVPGEPPRPAAVARVVRQLAGGRRNVKLFRQLLDVFGEFVAPGEIEVLRAELGEDPALLFAAAALLALVRHPLGRAYLEDKLKEEARLKVKRHLETLPGMERMRPVLYGVLYASLRREFEVERAHHVPRVSVEQALQFVSRCELPGPDTLPARAWALLEARVRLGLTQEKMAALLGVSRWAYSAMERGRKEVPAGLLEHVARCFPAMMGRTA